MRKLLFMLLVLPVSAMSQITLSPFMSGGYFKEAPNVKKSRVAWDYESLPSYEGAPRLVSLSDLYSASGYGFYAGGGVNVGVEGFPLSLQLELAGEHMNFSTTGRSLHRTRTEYLFDTVFSAGTSYTRNIRFTPSLIYKVTTKRNITLQAQAGVSLISPDNSTAFFFDNYGDYAAINVGIGAGYSGVLLNIQANFGTANMYSGNRNFTLYSRRISAGINFYLREVLEACR